MKLRKFLSICYPEKLFCQGRFFGFVLLRSKRPQSKSERAVALLLITGGDSEGRDRVIAGNEVGFEMKFGESLEDYFA